jgi:hypothetical protein
LLLGQNAEILPDFSIRQPGSAACVLLSMGRADSLSSLQGQKAMHVRALVDRVRGEFNEMPGLQLTVPQAAKLLGIEPEACRDVIDELVDDAFLRWTASGMIVRAER